MRSERGDTMAFIKNKALQVSMVNKSDLEGEPVEVDINSETIERAGKVTKELMQEAASLLLIYVAADTVRKVIIELAKK